FAVSDTMWMSVMDSPVAAPPAAKPYKVLICDDQPDVLEALRLLLKGQGWLAVTADSPAALLRTARAGGFDLILADLNYTRDTTSGQEGMDMLASLEEQGNTAPVVVMTAWGNVDLAVEAMRRGACDFVQKPWDNNRLLATIRKQAEPERRRHSELEIAANVQQKMFPRKLRRLDSLDYAGHCVPAREVGGDYYDFLEASERAIGFVLADVSGKGVPAALLMANLQACFRSQSPEALQRPSGMLHIVNKHFYESTTAERFATLFFGLYDDRTRKMLYVNCGHCPPFLLRANGEIDRLGPTATPLGAFADWKCREAEAELRVGDTLLLYSDGVTEAGIEGVEEFGEERLAHALRVNQWQPAEALVQAIVDDVADFSAGSRSDDVTVVGLRGI
ncbi:MAG TPA: SpoIIE family protein phosphatase, partial [Candidatus Solibacter sp.]|nr:SpoIIE family protein phosphatase [Candidatus Solibacter sp.]